MTKSKGVNRPRWTWTAEQEALVRQHYANSKTADLARQIGCSEVQLYRKAALMGLQKGEAFLATSASGRILRGGLLSQATQFKPGLQPWNRGKKLPGHGNAATFFKPGQRPHTWLPIGSFRISKDGYLQIKLTDTGYPPRDWVSYHQHVWEQANGPRPGGHVVVFKPGAKTVDRDLVTVDKLECISRSELMRRNSYHTNLPPELANLVQLRGAITRQIRKRAKEAAEP